MWRRCHHQKPDSECIAHHTGYTIETCHGHGGKGDEEKEPKEIESFQSHLYEQDIDELLLFNRQQQVGFDLLHRSRKKKAQQKINEQEAWQTGIEHIVGFHCGESFFKSNGQRNPNQNEVRCPKCSKQINQKLGKAVPVVHRVPLCGKFLIPPYFGQ